jgi:RHS repeat-associated protein
MKAISSQAAMKMQTRYKFNAGTELEDNFNVDYYETAAREYDAQLGRFTGIDAMSEKTMALTTYEFGGNSPISFNDPSGLLLKKREDIYDSYGNWNWNDVENSFASIDSYDEEIGIGRPSDLSGGYSGYTEQGLVHGINDGLNSASGGKVAADGSFTPFESDEEALNAGIAYMDANHAWGTNGWALNAIDARSKFNLSLIGIDPNNLNSVAGEKNIDGTGLKHDVEGTGLGVSLEILDNSNALRPFAFFAGLDVYKGVIFGIDWVKVQPQPASWEERTGNIISIFNIVVTGLTWKVESVLPDEFVEVSLNFTVTTILTELKQGKIFYTNSTHKDYEDVHHIFYPHD